MTAPIGSIVAYAGPVDAAWETANGWMACDGRLLDRADPLYTPLFDAIGFIWGGDLRWDPTLNDWIGDPSHSHDSIVKRSGDRFTDLVKPTYRVLLTRGLDGCYVYCGETQTRSFVEERMSMGRR